MTKAKTQEQKILLEFMEKYPELEEHLLYSYLQASIVMVNTEIPSRIQTTFRRC